MSQVRHLLEDADPLHDDLHLIAEHRERLRRTIVAAAVSGVRPRQPGRRLALTVSAAMLGFVLVGGWQLASRLNTTVQAAVRFEVRLAEEQPGPGLFQARVVDTDRVVYLHNEVVVANGDVALSRSEPTRAGYSVTVMFTPNGAEKMRQATSSHLGKPLAVLIDGEVVMAPVIRSPVTESAVITGTFDAAEADRIADGIATP